MKPAGDLLAEHGISHTSQPVGIAVQCIERLRIEQQRAAAQLVLNEEFRLGLDLRQLVHRFAELKAQLLRAPARDEAEIAQLGHVGAQPYSGTVSVSNDFCSELRSRSFSRPVP